MNRAPASAHLARAGRATLGRSSQGVAEVRRSWRIVVQATLAASLAYAAALASVNEQPFFAPIAAIATVAVLAGPSPASLRGAPSRRCAGHVLRRPAHRLDRDRRVAARAGRGDRADDGDHGRRRSDPDHAGLVFGRHPHRDADTADSAQPWNTGRVVDALIGGIVGFVVSALVMPVDPARHAQQSTHRVQSPPSPPAIGGWQQP